MKRTLALAALAALLPLATPAAAQLGGGRISVEPYVGYGFYGDLADSGATLEAGLAYGGRAAFQLSPQFGLFGAFQRSKPEVSGVFSGGGEREATVDHWSAGVEFSYVPRGGAEGMLPVLLEAGVGQARYDYQGFLLGPDHSDLAVNLGIASALQLSPNLAIRYGANDYISNWRDDEGFVNQIFVRVGAEITF